MGVINTSATRDTREMDDGGAVSLRTQFVHFIKNGKHERQIEDIREVGERASPIVKYTTERIDALRSFMGTEWKPEQETKKRARDDSQNDHSHKPRFQGKV